MNDLVTVIGGSGFVGTHFCQILVEKKIPFEILDLKISQRFPEKTIICDVREIQALRASINGKIVVNLAAIHQDNERDNSAYYQTNVLGAENITTICSEKAVMKIIFTSSVAVYGFAPPNTDETGAIKPFNEYGITKFAAEEKFRKWQKETGRSLTIIRPTVIFGPGNRGNVYNLFKQIASDRFLMVGRGENYKSMAYVANVGHFLEACREEKTHYSLYNYVDEPNFTMNILVSKVREQMNKGSGTGFRVPYLFGLLMGYTADIVSLISGRNLPVSSIRVKKFCSSSSFRMTKKPSGFKPQFSLYDAIFHTLNEEFYKQESVNEIFFSE
jgi:nucleoside-diphosphate-sugar epimerase